MMVLLLILIMTMATETDVDRRTDEQLHGDALSGQNDLGFDR